MARVFVSSVIDAPAAKVWERIRDFNGLPKWHPRIRDSRIENGEPSDRIGCVRDRSADGGRRPWPALRSRATRRARDAGWTGGGIGVAWAAF